MTSDSTSFMNIIIFVDSIDFIVHISDIEQRILICDISVSSIIKISKNN